VQSSPTLIIGPRSSAALGPTRTEELRLSPGSTEHCLFIALWEFRQRYASYLAEATQWADNELALLRDAT
jgi:hypothetical protein